MKKISLILSITVLFAASCQHEKDNVPNLVFKGPEVQAFGGKANTWLLLKIDGSPERLGITLTEGVLKGVASGGVKAGYMQQGSVVLPLHPKAAITPYKNIALDWDPQGHLPTGVFDLPSFAFHYNMIPEKERQAILNAPADFEKTHSYPNAAYLPPNFSVVAITPVEDRPGGGCFGAHWFDKAAPEFNQQGFTQTWSYGTYNGEVVFQMPMITLEFLKSVESFERAILQPSAFQIPGYYPTVFIIFKHNGVTEIVLDKFIYRQ